MDSMLFNLHKTVEIETNIEKKINIFPGEWVQDVMKEGL